MKNLIFISALILAFYVCSFAQTDKTLPCPAVEVFGPANVTNPGDKVIFTANIVNYDVSNLTYNWTVSAGEIIQGQGTSIISVSTEKLSGINIIATVVINGLVKGCEGTESGAAAVASECRLPIQIDDYGKIAFREEKIKLDDVLVQLQNSNNAIALFIISYTKNDDIQSLKIRIKNIVNHLIEVHKIPKQRINFIFNETDEYRTKIYLPPNDVGFESINWEDELNKLAPDNQPLKKSSRKIIKKN